VFSVRAKQAVSGGRTPTTSRFSSIVTPELEKSTEWVRTLQLSLFKSHVKLPGFRLYVVEEWVDESPFLYSSVLVHTGQAGDSVVCNVLRVTGNATPDQHRAIQNTFLNPDFPGLSVQPAEVLSNKQGGDVVKLGDVVVCDPEEFQQQGLHLIEVVNGALQGEALANIRLNVALKLFNCIKSSQVSSAAPSSDATERFGEMFRGYLQVSGKSTDSFRAVVRRLIRRIQGALMCLLYLPVDAEMQPTVNKSFLEALEAYRHDQAHQTIGVTPDVLRRLRRDQEALSRKLGAIGYAVPADPWSDAGKLLQAVQGAAATYAIAPTRRGWSDLIRQIDSEGGVDSSVGDSETVPAGPGAIAAMSGSGGTLAAGRGSMYSAQGSSPPMARTRGGGPPPMERGASSGGVTNAGPTADELQRMREATEVLEKVISNQQKQIAQAQAGYDSLYERYTAVSSKMYEALQEIDAYKLRVENLEGELKQLSHSWNVATESIREYNDTFASFESRVLRLDEHINNMYRRSRGVMSRLGLFVLQLLVWVVGLLFGYGVSLVYLFRRRPAEAQEAAKNAKERVAKFLGAPAPADAGGTATRSGK
jgi:hypothetical protein